MVTRYPAQTENREGFTLLEVLVSITVSSVLLGILFYLLSFTLDQWRSQTDGQINSAEARSALSYLEEDLKSVVVKNDNDAEWLRVTSVPVSDIGDVSWLTFLTRPTDVNRSESGDVCAVSYRVEKQPAFEGHEPVHALYRMALSPEETAAFVGTDDLNGDYWAARTRQSVALDRYLAGYVVGFDLVFRVRDPDGEIHVLEPNEEIRAARTVTVGEGSSVPDGSVLASAEIRLTVVNRGAQQILNGQTMPLQEIVTRYGQTYHTVVEFPHPSF